MLLDKTVRFSLAGCLLAQMLVSISLGSDWPQWRGPTRDGVAQGTAWPESLGEDVLKLSWRVELGPSYSGPIVVGDRVFTTETRDEQTEVASAYDRRTGKRLWEAEWPGSLTVPFFAASNGSWIRATPVANTDTLFVAGIRDVLVALDTQTGAQRWRLDFPAELGSEAPKFGCASSPLLDSDYLYAQMGGGFVKVHQQTGKVAWRVAPDGGGMSGGAFSSPYLTNDNGQRLAVVQTREALKGIDAETGDELWTQTIEAFRGMNILTPVLYDGKLFTSAHTGRSQLWRRDGDDPGRLQQVWSNKSQAYMSSPVVVGDHLYLHLRNQRIQCLDLKTGEEAWRTQPYGKYQSMAVLGDRILALDERGELLLFRANPETFEEIDRRPISEAETWAHIAVCGGQLFVRELHALAVYDWVQE
ncbi:PQQ-binding-like beta-propeller repeat protein [Botrimarina hoheduenensis]|uniref:Outer membrane biogenesis protein BamB n=1 Tax=Botrimarina hoheduenensis TaxID=2528000 RepID=A0A5C5WBX8_9BACT|nr:PQQ-binding-like beta-propeller repeat protein [Botrimarina hoheduenensis]TWT47605.1 outer membrane biogenesis protein BamB [Botrimarina hoheduenensis]